MFLRLIQQQIKSIHQQINIPPPKTHPNTMEAIIPPCILVFLVVFFVRLENAQLLIIIYKTINKTTDHAVFLSSLLKGNKINTKCRIRTCEPRAI